VKNIKIAAAATLLSTVLLLTACSPPSQTGAGSSNAPANADKALNVGFFGFAKSNGFAQGTYRGVEQAAKANNATATFVDPNFDAQVQVQQVQDAVTSKQFDVIVIQANDNQALIAPLTKAAQAGITVVVEFSVVGPNFKTIDPQIPGAISIVDLPALNGKVLGEMGVEACNTVKGDVCKVAYMEGFKSLPLDNVRTDAVKAELATNPRISLVADVEGGYTQDSGRAAFQNIIQANPDVNVVIGSSQAITGAAAVAGKSGIKFIGNGASVSNVEAVRSGAWFGIYVTDVVANGIKATELGLAKARGKKVETAVNENTLAPNGGKGTKVTLDKADYKSGYSD
jgi:ribose transport system substrate-binding protein